ncbi:hypothetical protein VNO78_10646 [Psophocarpus tetragonolobus]|uniref:Uncharacterized protein n=1 Tax=Psophocarpus tetragonolobus TaxID=3891 RepID=A0AAN9SRR7_PSOTE
MTFGHDVLLNRVDYTDEHEYDELFTVFNFSGTISITITIVRKPIHPFPFIIQRIRSSPDPSWIRFSRFLVFFFMFSRSDKLFLI